MEFLGFIIIPKGLSINLTRTEVIIKWPRSISIYNIYIFLGFIGFFRRFIKNYVKIITPLTDLFKKGIKGTLILPPPVYKAFIKLRFIFYKTPIFYYFNPLLRICLEYNISLFIIKAILF